MRNSRLALADVPADAFDTPLGQAVTRFHAALFRIDDCLRRCADACSLDDFASANFQYGDRQLMLLQEAAEQARVALHLAEREIEANYKPDQADGDGTLFSAQDGDGPYERGA